MPTRKNSAFNVAAFLANIGEGRTIVQFLKKRKVYGQGDESDSLFFLQKGKIRLTVVSEQGKEATIAIMNEGDFFGEGCLVGQILRMGTATTITDCTLLRLEKKTMKGPFTGSTLYRTCSSPTW